MGVEVNICVAVAREGGANNEPLSTLPRCIRAVRLSDAFCFRMTSVDVRRALFWFAILFAVEDGLSTTKRVP
jgi:hypothetical protein